MRDKVLRALRWISILPASVLGSYLVSILFYWLNKSKDYPLTNLDSLWDYAMMFISHALMGGAFLGIGVYLAPSYKRICACVLFAIACVFSGMALFANVATGFNWVSLVSLICLLAGAGYVFYISITDEDFKTE